MYKRSIIWTSAVVFFVGLAIVIIMPKKPQLTVGFSGLEDYGLMSFRFTNHTPHPLKCWWKGDWYLAEESLRNLQSSRPVLLKQFLTVNASSVNEVQLHSLPLATQPFCTLQVHFALDGTPMQLKCQAVMRHVPGLKNLTLIRTGAVSVKFPTAPVFTNTAPFGGSWQY